MRSLNAPTTGNRSPFGGPPWLKIAVSVLISFLLSGLFILLAGTSPLLGYRHLFAAGFGCAEADRCALLTTLQFMTPLVLTGLSATVAFRVGLFSIGQAGQMLLGAAAASWISRPLGLPSPVHQALALGLGAIMGGAWAWLPGLLRVTLDIHEVITTLVMNQLAFMAVGLFRLHRVPESLRLDPLAHGTKLNAGVAIALIAAISVYVILYRRGQGYAARMAGEAEPFARHGGVPSGRAVLMGMVLSGCLAGLAGAIEVLGVHYRFVSVFSGGGSFDGVAVALLSHSHPLAVPLPAFVLAGLRLGATTGLQLKAGVPRELGGAMIAMMILLVATEGLFDRVLERIHSGLQALTGPEDIASGN